MYLRRAPEMNLTSEDCRERPLLLARPRARTISRPAKRPGNEQKKVRLVSGHNLQLKQGSIILHILWTSNCAEVSETTLARIATQCD
jgi:hypothetical protein